MVGDIARRCVNLLVDKLTLYRSLSHRGGLNRDRDTMPTADRESWERLGRLLAARRVEISPRYASRRDFAAECMGSPSKWRTLHDLELAKRDTFRQDTIRSFEAAYRLVPGSIERTLAGGPLEPADVPGLPPRPVLVLEGDGPEAEFVAMILGRLAPEDRAVIAYIMRMNDGEGRPWSWERKRKEIEDYVDSVDGSGQNRPAVG